jgi:hypothetical protein
MQPTPYLKSAIDLTYRGKPCQAPGCCGVQLGMVETQGSCCLTFCCPTEPGDKAPGDTISNLKLLYQNWLHQNQKGGRVGGLRLVPDPGLLRQPLLHHRTGRDPPEACFRKGLGPAGSLLPEGLGTRRKLASGRAWDPPDHGGDGWVVQ